MPKLINKHKCKLKLYYILVLAWYDSNKNHQQIKSIKIIFFRLLIL